MNTFSCSKKLVSRAYGRANWISSEIWQLRKNWSETERHSSRAIEYVVRRWLCFEIYVERPAYLTVPLWDVQNHFKELGATHQSLLSHYNCRIMDRFSNFDCRYSFGIQPLCPKFCMALVTRYDIISYKIWNHWVIYSYFWYMRLVAMFWQRQILVYRQSNWFESSHVGLWSRRWEITNSC